MIRRDGQSKFVDELVVGKRGNIIKTASYKNAEAGADTAPEAKNVLKKFDKSPDVPDEYINKHVKMLEDGSDPKKVMNDFFKGLQKVKKSENQMTIRTAKLLRQNGMFKFAETNVYQDLDSGDFWKICEDGKSVIRMFKEVDGVTEGV